MWVRPECDKALAPTCADPGSGDRAEKCPRGHADGVTQAVEEAAAQEGRPAQRPQGLHRDPREVPRLVDVPGAQQMNDRAESVVHLASDCIQKKSPDRSLDLRENVIAAS